MTHIQQIDAKQRGQRRRTGARAIEHCTATPPTNRSSLGKRLPQHPHQTRYLFKILPSQRVTTKTSEMQPLPLKTMGRERQKQTALIHDEHAPPTINFTWNRTLK